MNHINYSHCNQIWICIEVKCTVLGIRKVWGYQRGNQKSKDDRQYNGCKKKGQTMSYKTLPRKLKIWLHEPYYKRGLTQVSRKDRQLFPSCWDDHANLNSCSFKRSYIYIYGGLVSRCMVFNAAFNNISVISWR
jgi:hypothetical protein